MAISQLSPRKSPRGSSPKSIESKALEIKRKLHCQKYSPLKKKSKKVSFNITENVTSKHKQAVRVKKCLALVETNNSAMKRAEEVQANLQSKYPRCIKPMLLSHVTGGFWLSLPRPFCNLHFPKEGEHKVVLVNESGGEYETKYLSRKNGLSGGWRGFSIAHNLVEGDVLVFQLIQPCKFKVYIVRANNLSEVDGAIGLLTLDTQARSCAEMAKINFSLPRLKLLHSSVHKTKMAYQLYRLPTRYCTGQTQDVIEIHEDEENGYLDNPIPLNICKDDLNGKVTMCSNSELGTSKGKNENDSDDVISEVSEGIRFSNSTPDFENIKSIDSFEIHVDGLVIDSEIPPHLRIKYYHLCCSQNKFLHINFLKGLNLSLVSGVISETVNIADAIRATRFTNAKENLTTWDQTFEGFEKLGMDVAFLRARIKRLINLAFESQIVLKNKKLERAKAQEEMITLEVRLSELKEGVKVLDSEIEGLMGENETIERMFKKEASASW